MTTITYDSVNLQTTSGMVIQTINHETTADKDLADLKLTNQDGRAIVGDTLGMKIVTIQGVLVGSSASDLETKMDALKEVCARKDKNLDIDYGGGTRRYVCRMAKVDFSARDHFHILFVPISISFIVPEGVGKDTAETTAINDAGLTVTTKDEAITIAGSYAPKVRHKLTITTRGNADVARIANQDTGDYIEIDLDGFSNGDYLEVDEENQTVKKNGSANLDFRGKFPTVKIGANNLRLTIYGSGYTLDQYQATNHGGLRSVIFDNTGSRSPIEYQSFVPQVSGKIKKLGLWLNKQGSPGGNVLFAIHADDNGVPGVQIGNSFQAAVAGVSAAGLAQFDIELGASFPFVVKGRRYWIRNFSITGITGDDISNFLGWGYSDRATDYTSGKALAQKTASVLPYVEGVGDASVADGIDEGQFDFGFWEYVGDGGAASHTITWQAYYTKKYL